ncbi:hypothetical protein JNM05_14435 [bacterium]|nr:hypothetical protein [bacterium]
MIKVLFLLALAHSLHAQADSYEVISKDFQYTNFRLTYQPSDVNNYGDIVFVECEITNNRIHPITLVAFKNDEIAMDMKDSTLDVSFFSGNATFKLEQGRPYRCRFAISLLDRTSGSKKLHSVTSTATFSDF